MATIAGVFLADLVGTPGYAQGTSGFKVIVNVSNPIRTMSKKQLGKIFLKKQEEWPNGFAITVADQRPEAPARQVFSREILAKDPAAVEAYWSKLIFSGMGIPPIKLASNAEVVMFIGNNVGSIGYVSDDTKLEGNVKELEVTP
jgi:ABC-type phosphate transport system substrate-binding protein